MLKKQLNWFFPKIFKKGGVMCFLFCFINYTEKYFS